MNSRAFTLLELMITITLFLMVSITIYVPYHFYQQKSHLKIATKQVEQFIQTARNSAVYGTASGSNLSFGLYLESGSQGGVFLFTYPFTQETETLSRDTSIARQLQLEPWVYVESIANYSNMLLFFEAISWKAQLLYWDNAGIKNEYTSNTLDIDLSYKWSDSQALQKTIRYYVDTHITDY